jgi:hypothetical protein
VVRVERNVRVELDGRGGGSITVDGVEIGRAVHGVTIDGSAGQVPHVAVFLRFPTLVLEGKLHPRPHLDEAEQAALIALGWTPPAEGS